jgi:oligoendopeptidase F
MNAETSKSIPQRADIDDKYKWRLSDLYKSEEDWEADYQKAQTLIGKAEDFRGKLAESGEFLYECLVAQTNLGLICENLHFYAKRSQDLDHRVSKYQALTDRAAMLASQAGAAYSFVEPELLKIDDEKLMEMADKFPDTNIYDFYIKELIRSRVHIRTAEIEELLAQSMMVARGPYSIFSMLNDADTKYPVIKDEQGNDIQLTKQRFAKLLDSSVQRVRRDAHEAFYSAYKDHVNTLGASLSSSVNKDFFFARARKYESCLHGALDSGNIPISVYHSLLDATEENLEGIHKWIALRKKILKLENIYPYDLMCPLFPDQNYEVPYEEAIEEVLQAIAPLGEKYREVLRDAFNSHWVDVYETEGKASGAYSSSNFSSHPVVLMNYNDTIDNMFTLAHEMGHCMHSYLSNKTQPYPKAHYTVFVAEVASTLNEGLMLQYLLKKADDKQKKLFLLNRHIDNTFGTFFHQVMYARFELMIHEAVEKGQALSPDTLNQIWEDLTKKYYGPAITMDAFSKYKWSRIPHFYITYYVYQYATSYTASQAILDKFLAGEKRIIDKYLGLLSSGGSDYPINQLKMCGVDMTTPAPVEATLKLFADQVNEVERLTQE